jgi:hypothetical protein
MNLLAARATKAHGDRDMAVRHEMTDVAIHPFTAMIAATAPRRRARGLRWMRAVLRRAAYRAASHRARSVRAWRRRQGLMTMFGLDDASLRALGVTRGEIALALEDGARGPLPLRLTLALHARRGAAE